LFARQSSVSAIKTSTKKDKKMAADEKRPIGVRKRSAPLEGFVTVEGGQKKFREQREDNSVGEAKIEAANKQLTDEEEEFLDTCRGGGPFARIEELIAQGASPNLQDPDTGETVLMLAARGAGSTEEEEKCDSVASIQQPQIASATSSSSAAMIMGTLASADSAAKPEALKIVKMLLMKGADVSATNHEGDTAFLCAAKAGGQGSKINGRILEALLDAKSDINHRNQRGETALMLFIEQNNQASVDMLLRRSDINVHLVDRSGKNALMYACSAEYPDTEFVESILRRYKTTDNVDQISLGLDLEKTAICIEPDDGWVKSLKGEGVMFAKENGYVTAKFLVKGAVRSRGLPIIMDLSPAELKIFDNLESGEQAVTYITFELWSNMLKQVSDKAQIVPHAINALAVIAKNNINCDDDDATAPLHIMKQLFAKGAKVSCLVAGGKTVMQYVGEYLRHDENDEFSARFPIWLELEAQKKRELEQLRVERQREDAKDDYKTRINFLQSHLSSDALRSFIALEEKIARRKGLSVLTDLSSCPHPAEQVESAAVDPAIILSLDSGDTDPIAPPAASFPLSSAEPLLAKLFPGALLSKKPTRPVALFAGNLPSLTVLANTFFEPVSFPSSQPSESAAALTQNNVLNQGASPYQKGVSDGSLTTLNLLQSNEENQQTGSTVAQPEDDFLPIIDAP
jgi:hypothetical protein